MNISIFGTGYVGLVTGACLANLGHNILCVDIDPNKITQLQAGIIPFYEPHLKDLVLKNTQKNRLNFTTNSEQAINFANVIFNCVGTPSNHQGAANLEHVFNVARAVSQYATTTKILINKSTVPPGTAKKCHEIINNPNIEVVSNPEFLAEGKAVHDFTHPNKIVVGANSHNAFTILRKIYTGRVRTYIPILETDWETAETIKYANNSFLATKISFINEIANICDKVGADVKIVAQALGMDYRINPKFLNPGVGYGGSCFPKDVRALISTAKEHGYTPKLLEQVDELNNRQKSILIKKIKNKFGPTLNGITLTCWGLSFKPKTSDIREAPSIVLIQELLNLGAKIIAYDPIATEEAKNILPTITYAQSIEESTHNSSAILLITEWDEFRNINFSQLNNMNNKIIFDGRNIYEPELIREEGFEYVGVGRS